MTPYRQCCPKHVCSCPLSVAQPTRRLTHRDWPYRPSDYRDQCRVVWLLDIQALGLLCHGVSQASSQCLVIKNVLCRLPSRIHLFYVMVRIDLALNDTDAWTSGHVWRVVMMQYSTALQYGLRLFELKCEICMTITTNLTRVDRSAVRLCTTLFGWRRTSRSLQFRVRTIDYGIGIAFIVCSSHSFGRAYEDPIALGINTDAKGVVERQ